MKYIIDIPDEVPVSDELVPFDMCRPSWYLEAYEKGKADTEDEVWEFARKMISTSGNEVSEMWGCATNFGEVMHNTTYSEAKAKYEAWRKQKDKIRVGDEVIYNSRTKAIVLKPETKERYGTILTTSELATISVSHDDLEKTGNHFDEVEELLKKVRDADEN